MADFKFFPSTKEEALAYLYVQKMDMTDKTPTDLLAEYEKAKHELSIPRKNAAQKYLKGDTTL